MKKGNKELLRRGAIRAYLTARPHLQILVRCTAACCGGLILSGVTLLGQSIPIALALVAALPFGLSAMSAYLGCTIGYFLFFGFSVALEPVAAGFLILAGSCIFHDLLPRDRRWFVPICAGTLYFLIGFVLLLGSALSAAAVVFFLARTLLLILCSVTYTSALQENLRAVKAFAICLLAGTSRILLPGSFPISIILASACVILWLPSNTYLVCAACCGLVLDLTCQMSLPVTAIFCLCSLLCHFARLESRSFRAGAFFLCSLACILFLANPDAVFLIGVLFGAVLAAVFPEPLLQRLPFENDLACSVSMDLLPQASSLLAQIAQVLSRTAIIDLEPQSAAVFDKAAEQICRSCGKWNICWEEQASETYLLLSRSAGRILRRGKADREDLPAQFLNQCCHADGFLTAINEAIETEQAKRQYQNRLYESRSVLSTQYRILSRFLCNLCNGEEPSERPAFRPELGFRAKGLRGNSISGDHGSSFQVGQWYYLLLCDGMGSGQDASKESLQASSLLQNLICAGFDAKDALEMLNGIYILRADGGFSTVDLLQISLVSGEGYLHKWGAAPSYLKKGRYVKKIGTASPPPGLGVGEAHRAECVRLSLQRGEVLVLVSDGVDVQQAEQFLRSCTDLSPRELASGLVCSTDESDLDDRTAAVLYLHPIPVQKQHSIKQSRILSKPHASPHI